MPVERVPISRDQFCELLGLDPRRFVSIESEPPKREDQRTTQATRESTRLWIVLEPEET